MPIDAWRQLSTSVTNCASWNGLKWLPMMSFFDAIRAAPRSMVCHRCIRRICWALVTCSLACTAVARAESRFKPYGNDPRIAAFADQWAKQNQANPNTITQLLQGAKRRNDVLSLMTPKGQSQSKNWLLYRSRFVTQQRVASGVKFWNKHRKTLARAQRQFGVDVHIILGILGVETQFGRNKGRVPTLDALVTLAFDFPQVHPRAEQRSAYFKQELSALLKLSQDQNQDVTTWRGSYAGALGYPQFMPSSWQKWGIDFDGDHQVDLMNSPADAIGSVAHYLQVHGWVKSIPTHWHADTSEVTGDLEPLLEQDILPNLQAHQLRDAGVKGLPKHPPQGHALALVELLNGSQPPSYVIGTPNFYAITRYNQSSYYALAVIELGEAIWRAHRAPQQPRAQRHQTSGPRP